MTELPLSGVRVLDFCWLIAGPLTTRLLADLGADVIKVESRARMDRIRETGVQPPDRLSPDTNGVFNDCNPNKRSLTIDLNAPGALALIRELVPTVDAVTSNFRPGRMERWGLGYDDLRRIRPDIIAASLPAFASGGPKMDWGIVGNGIVAMAGLNELTGFPERPPIGLGTLHSDFAAPYFAALALLAAFYDREATGEGQYIELSQYEAALNLLDTELLDHLVNGAQAHRNGNRSTEFAPHGVFCCSGTDRWVAIAVRDTIEWQQLCALIGRADLAQRADLQTLTGRRRCEAEIEQAIEAWTRDRDAWEIAESLERRGIPASPVEDVGDLVARDAGMRGHFVRVEHPNGLDLLVQHEPITWNGERLPVRRAPLLGEHSQEILSGLLGLNDERIAELAVQAVIF
jgi:benzylsuccinate CoA-transferase BbsF subunit